MPLTSEETIKDRLREAYDYNYYEGLYRDVARYNGCVPEIVSESGQNTFPMWPELRQNVVKLGEVFDSVYTMSIMMAKLRSRDVRPEFPDIQSPITKDSRSEWWRTRCRGTAGLPGWTDVHNQFTLWGIGFSAGVIEVGVRVNPKTGKRYVDHEHVMGYNFLYDRFALTANQMRWGARVVYVPLDDFKKLYPKYADQPPTQLLKSSTGNGLNNANVVRLIRYFDKDTYCVLLDHLQGDVIERRENPFTLIPYVVMNHLPMPGSRWGVGVIQLMMPLQIQLNKIRKKLAAAGENHGFLGLRPSVFSDKAIKDMNDPETDKPWVVELDSNFDKENPPYVEFPGMKLDQSDMRLYAILKQEFNPASGVNDLQRGNAENLPPTATGVEILQQQSDTQNSLSQSCYAQAMENLMQVTFEIARDFDEDPVRVPVQGFTITINGGDPATSMGAMLDEPSQILISEESIFAADADRKKAMLNQSLDSLLPYVQAGAVNLSELVKEKIQALGLDNNQLAQSQPQAAPTPGPQGQPGQPGQPQMPDPQQQAMPSSGSIAQSLPYGNPVTPQPRPMQPAQPMR